MPYSVARTKKTFNKKSKFPLFLRLYRAYLPCYNPVGKFLSGGFSLTLLLLFLIYLSFIGLGLPDSLLGSAWAVMKGEIGAPTEAAGYLAFLVSLCTVASSLLASRFLHRFGTGRVTLFSILLTALAVLGYSASRNFWMLLPCAVFLGLGAGAVDASLSNFAALHLKARHMSWLHCCWGIGAMVGPLLMSVFLQENRWRSGFLTVGILLAGIAVILLCTLFIWGKYEKKSDSPAEEERLVTNRQAFFISGVKGYMLAMLCYNGSEAAAGLWMASFFIDAKGLTPDRAAACCSLFYIGITLGRVLSGFLSEKLGDEKLIRYGSFLGCAGLLLMVLPLPVWGTAFGLLLTGFGGAPIYPSIVHAAPASFGEQASSSVIGLEVASGYVGATCIPLLIGLLANHFGMALVPAILLTLFILMLLSSESAFRRIHR